MCFTLEALAEVQQRTQALESLREAWLTGLERQAAEQERKALEDRLAVERLQQLGEEIAANREAKRRRAQAAQHREEAAAVAAKAEARQAKKAEKDAAAAAATMHRARMKDISDRLRRSKYWCDCGCPVHRPLCLIRDSHNSVLWLGADTGIDREELAWYYANGGRVVKGNLG